MPIVHDPETGKFVAAAGGTSGKAPGSKYAGGVEHFGSFVGKHLGKEVFVKAEPSGGATATVILGKYKKTSHLVKLGRAP